MKAEDLLDVIGDVDERYLQEVENVLIERDDSKITKRRYYPVAAIAASVFLLIGAGFVISQDIFFPKSNGATGNAVMQVAAISSEPTGKAATTSKDAQKKLAAVKEEEEIHYTEQVQESEDTVPMVIHFPVNGEHRMLYVEGALYADSGQIDMREHHGNMDGTITSDTGTTDRIPNMDYQSNFGKDFEFQWGEWEDETVIEVELDGEWHVFCRVKTPEELQGKE